MKEILEAVNDLSQYFEFDVEELVKITGLPITKLKTTIGQASPEPESPKTNTQKKKFSPPTPKGGLTQSLLQLPVNKPPLEGGWRGLNAGTWNKSFDDLINQIREGTLKAENLDKDFILKTYDRLNKAAANGYGKEYYNDETARKMRENLLRFSATKTHVQQKEVQIYSDSINDKKLYEQEAKKYLNLQNGTYLDVQASWAARSAQSARQFQEWLVDKDIFPHLKFRTMNDKDVRATHAVLEGMVISIDDPALDTYMPPLDPRCRCWLEQTREVLTNFTPDYVPDKQWAGNPAKTGEIFNDENSYNQKVDSKETRLEIRKQAELAKDYMPYNKVIKVGDNHVYVNDFADMSDMEQNITAAQKMAQSLDTNIYVRPHKNWDLEKNPELGISTANNKADLKTYEGDSKINNFIRNRIKDAAEQTASAAVLDLSKFEGSDMEIIRHIKGSLSVGNKGIKKVYVIKGGTVMIYTHQSLGIKKK